jgi:hypothetical protein
MNTPCVAIFISDFMFFSSSSTKFENRRAELVLAGVGAWMAWGDIWCQWEGEVVGKGVGG